MSDRPSKAKNYMDIATVVAERSHDAQTKVGAVLVNNGSGAIMATGYNGFVRGADDSKLPNTRPDKYEYILHAEENMIANCARHGISMKDTTLYCTLSPCKHCMRMLFNCGITQVVVASLYKDFDQIKEMKDISVEVINNDNGFITLKYTL